MRARLDREVDIARLGDELGEALGRPIALAVRMAGQFDEDGRELPGALVLLDDETGEPLLDTAVDAKVVQRVVAEHTYTDPDETPTADEALVAALETASTVAGLKAALVARFAPSAERARAARMERLEQKTTAQRR